MSAAGFVLENLSSLGGCYQWSLFRSKMSSDSADKLPGTTRISNYPRSFMDIFISYISLSFFFFSPLCIWWSIAMLIFIYFPYDLDSLKLNNSTCIELFHHRLGINLAMCLCYFGFWHISLYICGWGKRPFLEGRTYNVAKVVHNVVYTVLGVVQWTFWECVILHCYATKKIDYVDDDSFLSVIVATFVISIGRDIHFYFAHRFLHIKPFYAFIHSLHHRSTDVEPFSGLCMHPVEHLFYFTSYWPILCFKLSPFATLFVGVHLLLSPAAAHSGFEDHSGSDLFHYLHHKHFDVNFGDPGLPFDYLMGTYKDKLDATTENKGKAVVDRKANLLSPFQSIEIMFYWLSCVAFVNIFYMTIRQSVSLTFNFINDNGYCFAVSTVLYLLIYPLGSHAFKLALSKDHFTMEKFLGKKWLPAAVGGYFLSVYPVLHLISVVYSKT